MKILFDSSYVSKTAQDLIDNGYAAKTVYSINFDRYYTEEEQKENSEKYVELKNLGEWGNHCDEIAMSFAVPMEDILNKFIGKYEICQGKPESYSNEYYKSDWDLFCHRHMIRGYDSIRRFDSFSLKFNDRRNHFRNLDLLKEILVFVESLDYKNISCRVQWWVEYYNEKIEKAASDVFLKILNAYVFFDREVGRIKIVGCDNGKPQYGFFKKGSKKYYIPVSDIELLTMSLH